ncbi:unnamed protein product [Protopolystoma xenopodis]|uniref:Uncharacterized protein n=1 Tax=Protopolystoma xenopodis TaxID=117903 RepID=A0A448XQ90_9PLAT|nr:unnamed protein product [Protopolystoma xenopodis]
MFACPSSWSLQVDGRHVSLPYLKGPQEVRVYDTPEGLQLISPFCGLSVSQLALRISLHGEHSYAIVKLHERYHFARLDGACGVCRAHVARYDVDRMSRGASTGLLSGQSGVGVVEKAGTTRPRIQFVWSGGDECRTTSASQLTSNSSLSAISKTSTSADERLNFCPPGLKRACYRLDASNGLSPFAQCSGQLLHAFHSLCLADVCETNSAWKHGREAHTLACRSHLLAAKACLHQAGTSRRLLTEWRSIDFCRKSQRR